MRQESIDRTTMDDRSVSCHGEAGEEKEKEEAEEEEEAPTLKKDAATERLSGERCTNLCSTRQKKIGLLVFSILYIPLFAGAFFGFGPMQVMLEENGAFASVCSNDENTTATDTESVCPDQTARLLSM